MSTKQQSRKQKYNTTLRTLHYFWSVTRTQMGTFILGVLSTLGYILFVNIFSSYYVGKIVDRVSAEPVPSGQVMHVFAPYIIALIIVNIIGQLSSKLQDYACWKMEIKANYDLATYCFDTLSNQSMTFHTNRYGGSLVSQTTKFMSAYTQLLEILIYSLLPLIFMVVSTIVMLIKPVPLYVLVLCIMLVIYTYIAYKMYRKVLPLNAAASAAQNDLSGELSDSVTNILSVKTYGREDFERALFDEANANVVRADSIRMHSSNIRGAMTSSMIVIIMTIVTIFMCGGNAWFGITPGVLVMMFTYTNQLTGRFNMINSMMQRFNRAFGDAAGMTEILDEPTLVEDKDGAFELNVTEGSIQVKNLNFSYTDSPSTDKSSAGSTSSDKASAGSASSDKSSSESTHQDSSSLEKVFDNFELDIPAGQRIGLVGRSGAGKTTLTKLLLRLSDVQEGSILIDGQNISECTQQSLRRQIAYVPQEALLFHRTIRENIAYGKPDATDQEIIEAAREANALEFIEKLPHGFDTLVGERGIKLSGGQRQRISIARAILVNAPILILDEATSALDSESERLVQEALVNLMRGRTSIVVAHRLSTVASLDRIVVIADGKIKEDGTHHELIEANGEYALLWDRQTGAFLEE